MLGTVIDIRNKDQEAEIAIFGYENLQEEDPGLHRQLSAYGVRFFPHIVQGSGLVRYRQLLGMFLLPRLFWPRDSYDYIEKATVLSKGQETLTETYGNKHFFDSVLEQLLVSRFNKNITLHGQSIGPVKRWHWLAPHILRRFKQINVRDSISYEVVVNNLNISADKTAKIDDLAFSAVADYRALNEKPAPKHLLVIPNAALLQTEQQANAYLDRIAEIVSKENKHELPVLVASSVTDGAWNNDYALCNLLASKYRNMTLKRFKQLDELLFAIDNSEIVFSSRLHPIILSIGLGTRCVATADSSKIRGIIRDKSPGTKIITPWPCKQ